MTAARRGLLRLRLQTPKPRPAGPRRPSALSPTQHRRRDVLTGDDTPSGQIAPCIFDRRASRKSYAVLPASPAVAVVAPSSDLSSQHTVAGQLLSDLFLAPAEKVEANMAETSYLARPLGPAAGARRLAGPCLVSNVVAGDPVVTLSHTALVAVQGRRL